MELGIIKGGMKPGPGTAVSLLKYSAVAMLIINRVHHQAFIFPPISSVLF